MLTHAAMIYFPAVIKMRFSTDALVIKEKNIGENDRLVTLMTRDRGIIRAFATGAKSIKSRRGSATVLLAYSNFYIDQKGDTYRITEASPIRVFFGAGSDIVKLSLSQYFCELCGVLAPENSESENFLRLILNSLHFLSETDRSPLLIKAITELRTAVLSGYMPDLVGCCECGKFEDDVMYFDFTSGLLFCRDCGRGTGSAAPVDRTVLSAMRHIVYSDFKSLYSFSIPQSSEKNLSDITEKYILAQTEHRFATLDFFNSFK